MTWHGWQPLPWSCFPWYYNLTWVATDLVFVATMTWVTTLAVILFSSVLWPGIGGNDCMGGNPCRDPVFQGIMTWRGWQWWQGWQPLPWSCFPRYYDLAWMAMMARVATLVVTLFSKVLWLALVLIASAALRPSTVAMIREYFGTDAGILWRWYGDTSALIRGYFGTNAVILWY